MLEDQFYNSNNDEHAMTGLLSGVTNSLTKIRLMKTFIHASVVKH